MKSSTVAPFGTGLEPFTVFVAILKPSWSIIPKKADLLPGIDSVTAFVLLPPVPFLHIAMVCPGSPHCQQGRFSLGSSTLLHSRVGCWPPQLTHKEGPRRPPAAT